MKLLIYRLLKFYLVLLDFMFEIQKISLEFLNLAWVFSSFPLKCLHELFKGVLYLAHSDKVSEIHWIFDLGFEKLIVICHKLISYFLDYLSFTWFGLHFRFKLIHIFLWLFLVFLEDICNHFQIIFSLLEKFDNLLLNDPLLLFFMYLHSTDITLQIINMCLLILFNQSHFLYNIWRLLPCLVQLFFIVVYLYLFNLFVLLGTFFKDWSDGILKFYQFLVERDLELGLGVWEVRTGALDLF